MAHSTSSFDPYSMPFGSLGSQEYLNNDTNLQSDNQLFGGALQGIGADDSSQLLLSNLDVPAKEAQKAEMEMAVERILRKMMDSSNKAYPHRSDALQLGLADNQLALTNEPSASATVAPSHIYPQQPRPADFSHILASIADGVAPSMQIKQSAIHEPAQTSEFRLLKPQTRQPHSHHPSQGLMAGVPRKRPIVSSLLDDFGVQSTGRPSKVPRQVVSPLLHHTVTSDHRSCEKTQLHRCEQQWQSVEGEFRSLLTESRSLTQKLQELEQNYMALQQVTQRLEVQAQRDESALHELQDHYGTLNDAHKDQTADVADSQIVIALLLKHIKHANPTGYSKDSHVFDRFLSQLRDRSPTSGF